jgi:hypothetical protein
VGGMSSLPAQIAVSPGYFIPKNKQDTIYGNLIIPLEYINGSPAIHLLQWQVNYLDKKGYQMSLKPGHINSFGFRYKGVNYEFQSVFNVMNLDNPYHHDEKWMFLKEEVKGFVELFSIRIKRKYSGNRIYGASSPGFHYYTEHYLIRKNNSELIEVRGLSVKNFLKKYFPDHPDLDQLLPEKQINRKNLPLIIEKYNRWKLNRTD